MAGADTTTTASLLTFILLLLRFLLSVPGPPHHPTIGVAAAALFMPTPSTIPIVKVGIVSGKEWLLLRATDAKAVRKMEFTSALILLASL